jgi:hypothetical protein
MPKYQLYTAAEVASKNELRAFTGPSSVVTISQGDEAGTFRHDESDLTSADDDLDIIVDYKGRRWTRMGAGSLAFRQDGDDSVSRTAQDKMRELWTPRDKGAVVDDSTDDAAAVQAAQDEADTGYTVDLGNGVYKLVAIGTSPFAFGNQPGNSVYPAITVSKSNITFRGGRWHLVSRPGAVSADVQPVLTTAKNTTIGTLQNITLDSVVLDVENDGDANSNQRGPYVTGVRGYRDLNSVGTSTGVRRGYYSHLQNNDNVLLLGHYHYKMTSGYNLRYNTNVVLANGVYDDFSEAIDFDGPNFNVVVSNMAFRSTNRTTSQCMDLNTIQRGVVSSIVGDNVGSICTIQYKPSTPPTFAGYLQYGAWVAGRLYAVGDKVLASELLLPYTCTTGGISGETGPSGTGTGIADGACVWDYESAPFAYTPTKDLSVKGVKVKGVGTDSVAVSIGNVWPGLAHPGYAPVHRILLDDWSLEDTALVFVHEARKLTFQNFNLYNVTYQPASFGAMHLLSYVGSDDEYAYSDLDATLSNVSVDTCLRGAVRARYPRRFVIDGLQTQNTDTAASGDPDVYFINVETRGGDIFLDNLDLDRGVQISGNSASIPAWGATTVYVENEVVSNSGKWYRCTTGGTSAGAGGPTTTARAITDNTVTWRWMPNPFEIRWGRNNKLGGDLVLVGDSHKYIFGTPLAIQLGDVAATGAISKQLFVAQRRCYIARCAYSTANAVTSDGTDWRTLRINTSQAGAAYADVASITTASVAWSAGASVDGGFAVLETRAYLNPGDIVQFASASNGAGRAFTGLSVQLELIEY